MILLFHTVIFYTNKDIISASLIRCAGPEIIPDIIPGIILKIRRVINEET